MLSPYALHVGLSCAKGGFYKTGVVLGMKQLVCRKEQKLRLLVLSSRASHYARHTLNSIYSNEMSQLSDSVHTTAGGINKTCVVFHDQTTHRLHERASRLGIQGLT